MAPVNLVVRSATTFTPAGELDEEAFREYLQRFVDAKLAVYVASGGSGEGCALTVDELKRVYRAGVEACKGEVLIGSNQPDQHTPQGAVEHAQLAIDAGVDVVQLYGPASWHGYKSTDSEFTAYFDQVLPQVRHPVALSPNPTVQGAPPHVVAGICNRHTQVEAVNLTGIRGDGYCMRLREALDRDVDIYVDWDGSINTLAAGATGLHAAEGNFVPRTFRRYLDLYEAGDRGEAIGAAYADLMRATEYAARWKSTSPRLHKMVMKAFRLPGWEGGVREPHLDYDDAEVERFAAGALALGVPEIAELAREAGAGTNGRTTAWHR